MNAVDVNDIKEFLEYVAKSPYEMQEVMVKNGFVINDLNDRWQKLAFTLYTRIVSLSSRAGVLLEVMKEGDEP